MILIINILILSENSLDSPWTIMSWKSSIGSWEWNVCGGIKNLKKKDQKLFFKANENTENKLNISGRQPRSARTESLKKTKLHGESTWKMNE